MKIARLSLPLEKGSLLQQQEPYEQRYDCVSVRAKIQKNKGVFPSLKETLQRVLDFT